MYPSWHIILSGSRRNIELSFANRCTRSLGTPLTQFCRYIRHVQIGGGTNEIQRTLIARKLLRD